MGRPLTKIFLGVPFWQVDWSPNRFNYCEEGDKCRNKQEHDWRCDGQFFFPAPPKVSNVGGK